ncbi:chemotaxis protein CheA [Pokkaliibacter plantistimulans]|uniref:histidine kinase n=1 Tax=Pokkaliibacter plantistimulans TaxID=1635171 RepID=A0ABX5LRK3_9GAMM|nr:hybrid sensor histidine kinase/response regulator [Pokkaliibacter plantistimulans]PXF29275.1 chemotaxis protein CheA [Pokkaliibacter plantistimulans]
MLDPIMLELFRQEAETQTAVLTDGLLALERNPQQADLLESCMRAAHSLKGAARIVDLPLGGEVAHVMEDCLVAAQENRLLLGAEHIDQLLQGTDVLLRLAQPDTDPHALSKQAEKVQQGLQRLLESGSVAGAAVPILPESVLAEPNLDDINQSLLLSAADGPATVSAIAAEISAVSPEPPDVSARAASKSAAADRALRVSAEQLNIVLDLASRTLVRSHTLIPRIDGMQRLKRQFGALERSLASLLNETQEAGNVASLATQLEDTLAQLRDSQTRLHEGLGWLDDFAWDNELCVQRLYDTVLACRMRPFSDVLAGQARMVRDLARSLGKQAELQLVGGQTQVDRDILELLEAPLTHLLRNAVDHGVEAVEVRRQRGKEECGVIRLHARHHAGMLVVEVSDDGQGVDLDVLRRQVVERGFTKAETAARLTEAELLEFLFLPGFSMKRQVSEVSGRGVGLDAVQHQVRQLRGMVRVRQQPGKGTTFHLEVPLTLSVVRCLLVDIGDERYALPLAHIDRMLQVGAEQIVQLEGHQHCLVEGLHISLISARQILGYAENNEHAAELPVVLIGDSSNPYGVVVDRFIGESTLVTVPLDARLGKLPHIYAGAVSEEGAPLLILDVEDMLRAATKLISSGRLEFIGQSEGERQQRKRVLVVDDSLTVRELERKLLLNQGYDVAVAVDGMDGWNALRSEHFDLLLTDIDMPRMDGIELVTLVRGDRRLQRLPVMVVSYKDREEDRRRGLDAGADYYLAKANFHDDALLDAVKMLIGSP